VFTPGPSGSQSASNSLPASVTSWQATVTGVGGKVAFQFQASVSQVVDQNKRVELFRLAQVLEKDKVRRPCAAWGQAEKGEEVWS